MPEGDLSDQEEKSTFATSKVSKAIPRRDDEEDAPNKRKRGKFEDMEAEAKSIMDTAEPGMKSHRALQRWMDGPDTKTFATSIGKEDRHHRKTGGMLNEGRVYDDDEILADVYGVPICKVSRPLRANEMTLNRK